MDDMTPAGDIASVRAAALVEHYQKTNELVLHFWERRNRQFLILAGVLAVAGVASMLQEPLIELSKHYLETVLRLETPAPGRRSIVESVPLAYSLLVTFLMVAIFHLMADVYGHTRSITGHYAYIGVLEREIRDEMQLGPSHLGFTREGSFYRASGTASEWLVRWSYRLVLFFLLALFFSSRVWIDWPKDLATLLQLPRTHWMNWITSNFLFLLDVLLFAFTMLLFLGYAFMRAPSEHRVRQAVANGA